MGFAGTEQPTPMELGEPPKYSADDPVTLLKIPRPPAPIERAAVEFRTFLFRLSRTPMAWENPGLLDEAIKVIPLEKLYSDADEEWQMLSDVDGTHGTRHSSQWSHQDAMVRGLLRWFKGTFFRWVNNPPCSNCSSPTTAVGMCRPTAEEFTCGAMRVELFKCVASECRANVRFPRYGDVWKLLQTRRGRVGEWANCFGMLCRAIGCRVRWVWNREDHVWVEAYSDHHRRWIHIDPVEAVWDKPTLYSEGEAECFSYGLISSVDTD